MSLVEEVPASYVVEETRNRKQIIARVALARLDCSIRQPLLIREIAKPLLQRVVWSRLRLVAPWTGPSNPLPPPAPPSVPPDWFELLFGL